MFLTAFVAVSVVLAPATASGMTASEGYAAQHCDQGRVLSCIHRAALHRNISYTDALSVAWQESRYLPSVCNPKPIWDGEHACGLYQFIPSTWAGTPYARHSLLSAKWSALAYSWMIVHHRAGEFVSP